MSHYFQVRLVMAKVSYIFSCSAIDTISPVDCLKDRLRFGKANLCLDTAGCVLVGRYLSRSLCLCKSNQAALAHCSRRMCDVVRAF